MNTLNPSTKNLNPLTLHIREHGFFVLTPSLTLPRTFHSNTPAPATARFQHRRHYKVQHLAPFSNPTPGRSLKAKFYPSQKPSPKITPAIIYKCYKIILARSPFMILQ
ncbi:hypothetical protein PHAVU_006G019100 [Phaseolus vulgaris]|uniref:Uncharacterized protein n=1 Tax=Phaseolus vulgaris TaxID=3885 RepID=V7BNM5_PHAVU|nr:hypothetical protein PHAVU_006G019100g [Phaseolus vulgaris]ESW18171.1 hypothetical protein PHAVU_006G019100g [Phaseolus vulgaris]